MAHFTPLKLYFGRDLANLLSSKLLEVYPKFDSKSFYKLIDERCDDLELKDRNILFAESLEKTLTGTFGKDLEIFIKILGDKNKEETGMFNNYYHLWPIASYIELYGHKDFHLSMNFCEELTMRFTSEFAVRNLILLNPEESLVYFNKWAISDNFHVRRLASEGIRPKLPWAKKLSLFIDDYEKVFSILEKLKDDDVRYVQKSVANNINDYLKLNEEAAFSLLEEWSKFKSKNTFWTIKHALRNYKRKKDPRAMDIIDKSAKLNNIESYR
jgi:3-methyladenine DNA glycosylase AlkC